MEQEPAPRPVDLTGIHIDLKDQAIEFEDRYGTVGRLVFRDAVVLYEGRPLFVFPNEDADPPLSGETLSAECGDELGGR